jgi:hypothetical protein
VDQLLNNFQPESGNVHKLRNASEDVKGEEVSDLLRTLGIRTVFVFRRKNSGLSIN